MKRLGVIRLGLAVMGLAASTLVLAQEAKMATENGLYIDWRGGYGYVNSNPKTSAGVRKQSVKRHGTAYAYDIGYMFSQRFGIEGGRMDLRNVRYQGGQETNLTANYLAFKNYLAIAQGLDIYLKVGVAKSFQNNPAGNLDAGSNHQTVPYGALGIQGKLIGPTVWIVDATGLIRKRPVAAKYVISAGVGVDVLQLF